MNPRWIIWVAFGCSGALGFAPDTALSQAPAGEIIASEELRWPVRRSSVAFAFGPGLESPLAYDRPRGERLFNYRIERRGYAREDRYGALLLGHGVALAPRQGATLLSFFRSEEALSLEVQFTPSTPPKDPTTIVAFTNEEGPANFELQQVGDGLVVAIRTAPPPKTVTPLRLTLPDASFHHLVFSSSKAGRVLFLDGREIARAAGTPVGFSGWTEGELVFGSGSTQQPGWTGTLYGFAVYTEALSAEDARASCKACTSLLAKRKPVERTRLQGRLKAKSRVVTAAEISPYLESLSVFEYEVIRVLRGFYLKKTLRVAHFVVLGGHSLPFGELPLGEVVELEVEPWTDNPQLANLNLSDTLELDVDAEVFFDVGGLAVAWKK